MLCVNSYKKEYIEECRASMESLLAAYKSLAKGARTAKPNLHPAIDRFEPLFFNHLVVVLDGFFVHRSRTIEGKDGNPLNEFE